ncbi:ty3-gypsy retrotransposon protein [Cucumis melo var. makuwa]|uniref:Ty3-gypsy retrotransposon protein n=1 Tax=Cucumis melo var. makuwa TaxID=1194695 RepID=A0A5D3DU03_CUCMM|nr:ty3-gypsy retrotransposon protein [Cucumis melo var. makuwa]
MTYPNIMSVMVTDVDTSENRMAELEKKVNMLMKVVEEREYAIASLKNHIKSRDAAESSHKHTIKNTDKGKAVMQESQPQNSTSIASLSVQQLQEMIANSIKTQYGGPAQTSSLYSKPYTKMIDNLRMPNGYQPPKFQQFDGKGNPKQHVAHFIETCETAGTRGDLLVKQFVRTLKGNAFDCISHKKKGRRNKKIWNLKPIKGKDEDFLQPRRSITLAEFLPRSFLEDHPEEILEVIACHVASIVEVNNNYGSSEEVDNSNEIKKRIYVFDRIKSLTTRSSVFQRLSKATREEENQCPTSTYTRTSAFKRLSISTSKKARPSTFAFDRVKMTNYQQQREMKSLKAKLFHEENDDNTIHSCVPSRMKRKLSIDINTEAERIFIFIFSNMLQAKRSSSQVYCSRECRRLKYVAVEKVVVSYMLQLRMSSSQICCRREGRPLKYVAAEKIVVLKYVAAEKIIVSNMLQLRRSSSQICCSQKDLRLKYIVAKNVIVSIMLQPRKSSSQICCNREIRRLIYAAADDVVISNMLPPRRSSPQICCS